MELSKKVLNTIVGVFLVAILVILGYLSTGDMTVRETGLLSTILTLASVVAAWIISHIYSSSTHAKAIEEVKNAHQENLQTYALKAAEKVNNLSDQINKLSIYLEEELQANDRDTVESTLSSREERMQSAIHMLGMLKSINDTSLSDWEGVIGDQLEEQREIREEQQQELRELIEKIDELGKNGFVNTDNQELSSKVNILTENVKALASATTGSAIRVSKIRRTTKRDVKTSCINCDAILEYRQRAKANSAKAIDCPSCRRKYISRFNIDEDNFYLTPRDKVIESVECTECGDINKIEIDNFPGSNTTSTCEECGSKIRIARLQSGQLKVTVQPTPMKAPTQQLDEVIIEKVRELLPNQPWITGVHREVASQLNISNNLVHKAIDELIQRGVFKHQINGKLYDMMESQEAKA